MERDQWEEALARALARAGGETMRRVMEVSGDPPAMENLLPSFWDEFAETWRGAVAPNLEKIFLEAAQEFLAGQSVGVDWARVNEAAAQWARGYTFDLVRGITNTTRDALREKVSAFFANGLNLGQLRESIAPLFGPMRAEMIAITEVTRAATNGEAAIVNFLELEHGLEMAAIFQTSNDEIVCPLCAPLNGKRVKSYQYPPLHPRCRCALSHEFV